MMLMMKKSLLINYYSMIIRQSTFKLNTKKYMAKNFILQCQIKD